MPSQAGAAHRKLSQLLSFLTPTGHPLHSIQQEGALPGTADDAPLHAVPFYFFLRAITLYTAMAAMVAT